MAYYCALQVAAVLCSSQVDERVAAGAKPPSSYTSLFALLRTQEREQRLAAEQGLREVRAEVQTLRAATQVGLLSGVCMRVCWPKGIPSELSAARLCSLFRGGLPSTHALASCSVLCHPFTPLACCPGQGKGEELASLLRKLDEYSERCGRAAAGYACSAGSLYKTPSSNTNSPCMCILCGTGRYHAFSP